MTSLQPAVRFGHVKEDIRVNRSNRNRITQADKEAYPRLKETAAKLDAALSKSGLDTGETSRQLKLSTIWPHNYIQLSVADDATRLRALKTLEEFGALQDPQKPGVFVYNGQKINLQTYAEADYQNGLPFTFLAKKCRQALQNLQERLGFLNLPT